MVAGDSVPDELMRALALQFEREGWEALDAAVPGCGVVAVHLVNADGSGLAKADQCPTLVPQAQRAGLAQDPDVVLWWDRFSLSDFKTSGGEHVRAGTDRFWTLRRRQLDAAVTRMRSGGATVVLLATEPVGLGIQSRCTTSCHPWIRRQIERSDWRRRWNRILRAYAMDRPGTVAYRTITPTICSDTATPCNDRLPTGQPAREDGTHYSANGGKARAAAAVATRLRTIAD